MYDDGYSLKSVFPDRWNNNKQEWEEKKLKFFERFKNYIKNLLKIPIFKNKKPSLEELHMFISFNLIISTNKKNMITTIEANSNNKDLWIYLIPQIHKVTDDMLKETDSIRTSEYIKVLNEKLLKTTRNDQESALIFSLGRQYNKHGNQFTITLCF